MKNKHKIIKLLLQVDCRSKEVEELFTNAFMQSQFSTKTIETLFIEGVEKSSLNREQRKILIAVAKLGGCRFVPGYINDLRMRDIKEKEFINELDDKLCKLFRSKNWIEDGDWFIKRVWNELKTEYQCFQAGRGYDTATGKLVCIVGRKDKTGKTLERKDVLFGSFESLKKFVDDGCVI